MMQPRGDAWSSRTPTRTAPVSSTAHGRTEWTSARAREATRRRLAGIRPVDPSQVDDVMLVVSELVTNAQRHGGGVTGFGLDLARDAATVVVSDASSDPPDLRRREELVPGGFGWPIVLHLCREVAVSVRPEGKTIRAVVPLDQ
ncbi:ATP-binding protein [Streptomyces sp. ISL-36]|uniref:ATP-binding protein n=1 Tax=Streptomyces sp. ISL-36 TaxID=2819182 RepID=UPI001BE6655D|nr:ATP-binding protein [Streptomyces sp. ISL-36]MBT2444099.1 ATP-binding protein [Streptomyces sp. ISL-36]